MLYLALAVIKGFIGKECSHLKHIVIFILDKANFYEEFAKKISNEYRVQEIIPILSINSNDKDNVLNDLKCHNLISNVGIESSNSIKFPKNIVSVRNEVIDLIENNYEITYDPRSYVFIFDNNDHSFHRRICAYMDLKFKGEKYVIEN